MGKIQQAIRWLNGGGQRRALAHSLRKPMTATELLAVAKSKAGTLRLRHVSTILKAFRERGLVERLNPDAVTGGIDYWTPFGQKVLFRGFGMIIDPVPENVDWHSYGFLKCAPVRRLVFLEVAAPNPDGNYGKTATEVKRALRHQHPIRLNGVIRALHELLAAQLICCIGVGKKSTQKRYGPTESGITVAGFIQTNRSGL